MYRPSNWRTVARQLTKLANGAYASVVVRPGRHYVAMGFSKLGLVSWTEVEEPVTLHSGGAMFCEFSTVYRLIGNLDQAQLKCSDEPVAHPDLWRWSLDEVEPDPHWKP